MQTLARFAFSLFALSTCGAASAAPCSEETYDGTDYIVCSFDPAADDIRMFWRDGEGDPFNTFPALAEALAGGGLTLTFAINGGMYGDDFVPTGLYVEKGAELAPLNTKVVTGEPSEIPNFYKQPNGVFALSAKSAAVMTTEAFAASPELRFATQSGPMLVIDGDIHPAFIEGSTDRKPRDGVGVDSVGKVHFAISDGRVNFHDFARFFRDGLGCPNALFLDGGSAPGIYSPELNRSDQPGHGGFGPIIAVVK